MKTMTQTEKERAEYYAGKRTNSQRRMLQSVAENIAISRQKKVAEVAAKSLNDDGEKAFHGSVNKYGRAAADVALVREYEAHFGPLE